MNYYIETYVGDDALNPWVKTKQGSKQYCQGWLDARKDHSPRRHMRLCRDDGKVVEEVASRSDVWIGQIAGWPTAEQYERAAYEAIEKARHIRASASRSIK